MTQKGYHGKTQIRQARKISLSQDGCKTCQSHKSKHANDDSYFTQLLFILQTLQFYFYCLDVLIWAPYVQGKIYFSSQHNRKHKLWKTESQEGKKKYNVLPARTIKVEKIVLREEVELLNQNLW